jgi:hypothetical protein
MGLKLGLFSLIEELQVEGFSEQSLSEVLKNCEKKKKKQLSYCDEVSLIICTFTEILLELSNEG